MSANYSWFWFKKGVRWEIFHLKKCSNECVRSKGPTWIQHYRGRERNVELSENKPPTPSHTHTNTHTLAEALQLQSLQQSDRQWRKPCRQGQTMQTPHTNINKSKFPATKQPQKPMNKKCEECGAWVNLPKTGLLHKPSTVHGVRETTRHLWLL